MGRAGELKRQCKERGIVLPPGCLEVTELEELLSHGGVDALPDDAFQQVSLPDEALLLVIAACSNVTVMLQRSASTACPSSRR